MNKKLLYEKIEEILNKSLQPPFGKERAYKENLIISLFQREYLRNEGEGFEKQIILSLIQKIIYNDPIKNSIFKGKRESYIGLPKNKSLFFAKDGCGLPIGNLTSQLFSNVYLDNFDKFVKNEIGCKYYGRYVDDFIIVHENKEFLVSLIPKIRTYLLNNLGLILHPDKIYLQHYSKGVLFLGNIIKPYRNYTRNRTLGNFYKSIQNINKKYINNEINTKNDFKKYILSPINSYLGFIKNTSSFKIKVKILKKLDKELLSFLYLDYKFNKIILKYDKLPKFTDL